MKKSQMCWSSFLILSILILMQYGCAGQRPFVWVEDLPKETSSPKQYRISPGNRLAVTVWGQSAISGEHLVRADGYISVVLVGDIFVKGMTTEEAARKITQELEGDIVQNVRVDVSVIAPVPQFITIVGEVQNQGKMELNTDDNLIDVISRSGGFTEFANTDEIYLLRKTDELLLVRFDFDRLTSCPNAGIDFQLHDGDIIIVD